MYKLYPLASFTNFTTIVEIGRKWDFCRKPWKVKSPAGRHCVDLSAAINNCKENPYWVIRFTMLHTYLPIDERPYYC